MHHNTVNDEIKIITLIENTTISDEIVCEHGLSVYLETPHHKLLVDTGRSGAFIDNAQKLSVDITQVDTLILSHGHYDHSGGILRFAEMNPNAKVYINEFADGDFYHGEVYIGINKEILKLPNLVKVSGNLKIDDELEIFTKATGRRFWPQSNKILCKLESGKAVQDDFKHEQYAVIHTKQGDILISGCAHNGILNILDRYQELYKCNPYMIISGFHMMKDSEYTKEEIDTIESIAKELATTDILLYTGHCTSDAAIKIMQPILGDKLHVIHSGERIM